MFNPRNIRCVLGFTHLTSTVGHHVSRIDDRLTPPLWAACPPMLAPGSYAGCQSFWTLNSHCRDEALIALDIALDIALEFEKAGAFVLTARSLAEATDLVEHDGLAAAVLDFGLGDGDAEALCVRLNGRGIPFVLHSGYSHHGPGCSGGLVVPKPANPSALIAAVCQMLTLRRDRSPC